MRPCVGAYPCPGLGAIGSSHCPLLEGTGQERIYRLLIFDDTWLVDGELNVDGYRACLESRSKAIFERFVVHWAGPD